MKKYLILPTLAIMAACGGNTIKQTEGNLKLWYDSPATVWEEALPIGNGRIAAMIYGGIYNEEIQLNEGTLWSGSPYNNVTPVEKDSLAEIRRMVFDGEYVPVMYKIMRNLMTRTSHGQQYQPAGSLFLIFPSDHTADKYYRELDISQAVSRVSYEAGGVGYSREYFSSFPDQLIVMKLSATKKKSITFTASINSPLEHRVTVKDGILLLTQRGKDWQGIPGKVEGAVIVKIDAKGGSVAVSDETIDVENADEVYIYVSLGTNFINYEDISGNALASAEKYMKDAGYKSYKTMLRDHVDAYKKYFDRVTLDLGTNRQAQKPTDQRVREFSTTDDPQMAALYFQFGRYLLISSSQPCGQPANLQGIWNKEMTPPWGSKYTVNINAQMNYWPAEITNLPETLEPFIRMVRELSITGRESAHKMYFSRGWMLHHNTDIWRSTGLVDGAWGAFVTSNAWMSQHLWNKYLYGGDKEYLRSIYPIMKEACEFFLDFLVVDPNNGWLVTNPANSPENAPGFGPARSGCISPAPTMDIQLINDLFANTILAGKELGIDNGFADKLARTADSLPPMQIGRFGQLQEWLYDWDNPDDTHRHVSHLWGVYPGNQISPYRTPALFDAARTSLLHRGDASTGWSMGWKVCLWARFRDGEHALKLIKDQIAPAVSENGGESGGTYPNLFDSHPPFQIDGNFGCAAGIAEMLVQSYDGAIDLLPALPKAWSEGSLMGIRTVGGFTIEEMKWGGGKLTNLTISSSLGGNCRIRLDGEVIGGNGAKLTAASGENPNPFFAVPDVRTPLISAEAALNDVMPPDYPVYDLPTEAGRVYKLKIIHN